MSLEILPPISEIRTFSCKELTAFIRDSGDPAYSEDAAQFVAHFGIHGDTFAGFSDYEILQLAGGVPDAAYHFARLQGRVIVIPHKYASWKRPPLMNYIPATTNSVLNATTHHNEETDQATKTGHPHCDDATTEGTDTALSTSLDGDEHESDDSTSITTSAIRNFLFKDSVNESDGSDESEDEFLNQGYRQISYDQHLHIRRKASIHHASNHAATSGHASEDFDDSMSLSMVEIELDNSDDEAWRHLTSELSPTLSSQWGVEGHDDLTESGTLYTYLFDDAAITTPANDSRYPLPHIVSSPLQAFGTSQSHLGHISSSFDAPIDEEAQIRDHFKSSTGTNGEDDSFDDGGVEQAISPVTWQTGSLQRIDIYTSPRSPSLPGASDAGALRLNIPFPSVELAQIDMVPDHGMLEESLLPPLSSLAQSLAFSPLWAKYFLQPIFPNDSPPTTPACSTVLVRARSDSHGGPNGLEMAAKGRHARRSRTLSEPLAFHRSFDRVMKEVSVQTDVTHFSRRKSWLTKLTEGWTIPGVWSKILE